MFDVDVNVGGEFRDVFVLHCLLIANPAKIINTLPTPVSNPANNATLVEFLLGFDRFLITVVTVVVVVLVTVSVLDVRDEVDVLVVVVVLKVVLVVLPVYVVVLLVLVIVVTVVTVVDVLLPV